MYPILVSDVIVYAYIIFDDGLMNQLGKELPLKASKDTGAAREYSRTVGAINRRRQRQRRSEMTEQGSTISDSEDDEEEAAENISGITSLNWNSPPPRRPSSSRSVPGSRSSTSGAPTNSSSAFVSLQTMMKNHETMGALQWVALNGASEELKAAAQRKILEKAGLHNL